MVSSRSSDALSSIVSLHDAAYACLMSVDAGDKVSRVHALRRRWEAGEYSLDQGAPPKAISVPGRPARPVLVPPARLERRKVSTLKGRAALIHALAHIEFNAINLALDAVYRFRALPSAYYDDWLRVADEEASHYHMLVEHLACLGFSYGDFTAHNGLWEMAVKTDHDPLVRMALVPRILEARGLDASPAIRDRLAAAGDMEAARLLDVILRDEIGHVAIGNRWYGYFCALRGLDPVSTFARLMVEHDAPRFRPPFHEAARRQAGFSEAELRLLHDFSASPVPDALPRDS